MTNLTSFQEIPVVNVSGLFGTPEERAAVAAELGRAAREVGFLYVTGSGVPAALFEDLLAVTKAFFALPLEEKMKVYIGNSSNHRGYVPTGEEGGGINADQGADAPLPDLKEAFDLSLEVPADDPDYLAGNPMVGPNQWPDLPHMAETVNRYYDAVLAFYHRHGATPVIAQQATQMQTIVNLVSAGLGLALVPEVVTQLQRPGVIYRPVPAALADGAPRCETSLLWPDAPAPAVARFVEFVRALPVRPLRYRSR